MSKLLNEREIVQEIKVFKWFRHLWVDGTDGFFGISENLILCKNWVQGELFTAIVLVSIVVLVRECRDVCSGIEEEIR